MHIEILAEGAAERDELYGDALAPAALVIELLDPEVHDRTPVDRHAFLDISDLAFDQSAPGLALPGPGRRRPDILPMALRGIIRGLRFP
ncbi:hypothetical protein [Mycolicibacterium alvei]|uniref:hypothetical protein n=1 Tax=Mycolicibacterium alvei TaxID=67081 RepID=UPI0013D87CE6|nr:hypothetical protein [Mycolicibacterium alvei]MCV7000945.1 hypothetical protein [Mycolicibacterium alvei]